MGLVTWLRRPTVALLAACVLSVLIPANVSAHAALQRAEPAPDSAIKGAPDRVTIWFSEPIAASLSEIEVFDAARRKVDRKDVTGDTSDGTKLSVGLEALNAGTYTVAWRNVSSVDGHALIGSYVFYVGERPADAVSTAPAAPPALLSPADPFLRWAVLLSALTIVGGYLFEMAAFRPALAHLTVRGGTELAAGAASNAIAHVRQIALVVFAVASAMHLLVQVSVISAQPLWAVRPSGIRDVLLGTTWGMYWLVRIALVSLAAVAARLQRNGISRHVSLILWIAVLATFTGSSHAAATRGLGITGVTADYVHLLAAALWVGGLFALLPTMLAIVRTVPAGERRQMFAALIARFSLIASLGLGTLLITGLFASWLHVGGLAALNTPYGWSYGVKMILFGVLALIGAVNLLWVRPRLGRAAEGEAAALWLQRLVTTEVVLGVLVVLAVGFMTSMEPARQSAARANGNGVVFDQTDGATRIKGRVEPGLPGNNRVRVELLDRKGEQVRNASTVTVVLKYLDVDLGESTLTATLATDGLYEAPNVPLSIGGAWQVQVRVTRPDAGDAAAATRFSIGISGTAAATGGAAPELARTLWSWAVVGLGMLWLVLAPRLWRSRIARGRVRIVSTAALLAGVVLVYGAHVHGGPVAQANVNPVTPNAQSIDAGRALYQQHCAVCHGELGLGDGPRAKDLNPPPLNLTVHVPLHGDGQLFQFISAGVPGTAMPVWGSQLSDTQMWNLVNYLRTLAKPAALQ